ncbi:hypothetical protein SECTIM467_93 [Brevibacillus phage SecTim467]|uniref:Uncharacterized protein n=2 Tax=Jenstvirus jenst TaxID=1982225 RepID=A0A0K2CPA1_9CAUD|nr:hypothetical protein AVV11_gp103 [Brevibacillus phage Jenst]ALA07217.1 hypothetical protein JENST_88 [Brevibacillus phage Jenst]ALA07435.1 hypothetical protein SECTIM467_93 [Brevibacillus phage SecTim467]
MNSLEHYIVEVKSVEPCTEEWTKRFDKEFVKINVITDCYGVTEEREVIESVQNWEKIKERGYFMW